MRTIRAGFREGCDIRFDYFVYIGNVLSLPPKSRRAQGRNAAGADATAASVCAIMAFQTERQQLKNRSSALSALVCSLGASPRFASDTTRGQGFNIGVFAGPSGVRR